jgi:hypothetical protein
MIRSRIKNVTQYVERTLLYSLLMAYSYLPRLFVPLVIGVAFSLFRRYFPAKPDLTLERYDRPEGKRLPTGAFSAITIAMGLAIAVGGYFVLLTTNHLFAKSDGPALAQTFPVRAIWCFLPGFAALAVPWPLTIALLRRSTYHNEAAYVEDEANRKSGFDCFRIMVGINLFLVLPIAIFTFLALPERLTLANNEILWTHYASLTPAVFAYSDIVRLTSVDGYKLRDGTFKSHKDLLLIFKDGRRLSLNAVGDGGSEPSAQQINVILMKTGLVPEQIRTIDELQ